MHQSQNADSGGKQLIFPSISSLKGRVFSISGQTMDGPNPSEMDVEVFIPEPTYCLQTEYCLCHTWRN